jgi:alkaline phosphatase D
MGKQTLFGQIGSRYLTVKPTYDLWAAFRVAQNAEAEDPYGAAQSAWLDDQLAAESDATWKILGSSTSQTTLGVNLTPFAALLPPGLAPTQLYLDCDGWDGFPVGQKALHAKLAAKNVVIVSGDIHASYVADYGADGDGNRLVELTGTSVSAQTFAGELHAEAALVPGLADHLDLVDTLISLLDDSGGPGTGLLYEINHNIRYANSYDNGVVVVSIDASHLAATYSLLAPEEARTDSTGSPAVVDGKFKRVTVQVPKTGGKNGDVTVTRS